MRHILKFSSLFTGLIAVSLVATLEKPYNASQGLPSAYQTSWITWEEQVFDRYLERLRTPESLDKGLEKRITRLISRYKTGLKKDHLNHLSEQIVHESRKYGYDPLFLAAIIITESSFNNWAQSNKGALGLMQIRPATGKELASEANVPWKGKPTLFDPKTNIILGTYYLNKLVLRFGDLDLALEAYNHGPSRLKRYLGNGYRPRLYSQKVFRHYSSLRSPSI